MIRLGSAGCFDSGCFGLGDFAAGVFADSGGSIGSTGGGAYSAGRSCACPATQ